jgi:hypothetical protein
MLKGGGRLCNFCYTNVYQRRGVSLRARISLWLSLNVAEVESAGPVCGPSRRLRLRVPQQHVRAGPARDRHQATFGAACGEPAVRRGVTEPVWVETCHPAIRARIPSDYCRPS